MLGFGHEVYRGSGFIATVWWIRCETLDILFFYFLLKVPNINLLVVVGMPDVSEGVNGCLLISLVCLHECLANGVIESRGKV